MDQNRRSKNPSSYARPVYSDSSPFLTTGPSSSTSSSQGVYSSIQKNESRPLPQTSSYTDLRNSYVAHHTQPSYSPFAPLQSSYSQSYTSSTEQKPFHSSSNYRRRSDRSSKKKKEKQKAPTLTNVKVLARPSSAQKESSIETIPAPQPKKVTSSYAGKQDSPLLYAFEELSLKEEVSYVPGTHSIQLLDKTGKLRTSDLKKLLNDHPASLVIGVFGSSGLGKSYILSEFSTAEDKSPFSISGSDTPTSSPKPFAVYAHITPNRLILLDTQLYFPSKQSLSPTTLLRRSRDIPLNPTSSSVLLETLNVQLCAWLLSVTDVCFFFHPQPTVPKDLLECLKKAREIVQCMPFSLHSSTPVFLRNRVPVSEYTPSTYQTFLQSIFMPTLDDSKPFLQLNSVLHSLVSSTSSSTNVNHFWLPDFSITSHLYPFNFEECLAFVKCKIYSAEKKKFHSEMDCLKLIIQAWDFLKRSEYMIKP